MSGINSDLVVVVEDDASVRRAVERILGLAGLTSALYASAEEMLARSDGASAACLILDVQLPRLTGFELYEHLMNQGHDPPVIFITAFDGAESYARAMEFGAADYLVKPFAGRRLVDSVRRVLRANSGAAARRKT